MSLASHATGMKTDNDNLLNKNSVNYLFFI